jgi:hypothetical protein
VKTGLISLPLPKEASWKKWNGGTRNLTVADFAEAFQQWCELSGKCVAIASNYVEET